MTLEICLGQPNFAPWKQAYTFYEQKKERHNSAEKEILEAHYYIASVTEKL
jgi:hypothetical protein